MKKINAVLLALLAFLGFSACQPDEPDYPEYGNDRMYGVRMTNYSEKLSVSDQAETDITLDFEQQ